MRFYLAFILYFLCFPALFANPPSDKEQLQLSQCLAAKLPVAYPVLAENKGYKIIEVPVEAIPALARLADKAACGRFINLTDQFSRQSLSSRQALATSLLALAKNALQNQESYAIAHASQVMPALEQVNESAILATLTHLTAFYNRSALSTTGVETANWLKDSFDTLAHDNHRTDVASWFVKTNLRYKQPSLVTVIGKDLKTPAVVIGAHMDTFDGRMPGAGDDGSGSADAMEIARVLLSEHLPLKNPVYIVWYAAEERGLVGSQRVVAHFLRKEIPVKAVIQLDMTGYRRDPADPTLWVFTDYTDNKLSDFVAELIKTYLNVPVGKSQCGYGCSDHASWTAKGFAAAFPCETDFEHKNDKIHTFEDTIDRLTPEHLVNFAKLGVAFALELAL